MDDAILHSYKPPLGEKLEMYRRLEEEFQEKSLEKGSDPLFMPEELQDPQEWKNFFHWKMLKLALEQQISEEYLALRQEAQEKGTLEIFLKNYGQLESRRPQFEIQGTAGLEEFLQKLRDIGV